MSQHSNIIAASCHRVASSGPPLLARADLIVTTVIVSVLVGVGWWRAAPDVIDDAHITFRYVDNLLAGRGLTYNPGTEPVEGFSTPVMVLLLWIAGNVGVGRETAAVVLGAIGWLVAIAATAGIARGLGGSRAAMAAASLATAAHFPLLYFSVTGLETGIATGLIAGALWRYSACGCRVDAVGAMLWLATALVRPEGVLYPVAIGILEVARWTLKRPRGGLAQKTVVPGRESALWLFGVGILIGVALIMRRLYFDAWLPNTFHAKPPGTAALDPDSIGLVGALRYLFAFARQWGFLAPIAAILGLDALLVAGPREDQDVGARRPMVVACILVLSCALLFGLYTGGDWMPGARYLLPAVPVIAAAALAGAEELWRNYLAGRAGKAARPPSSACARCVALFIVGSYIVGPAFVLVEFVRRREVFPFHVMNSERGWQVGLHLRRAYPPETRVVAFRIGAVGRSSGMVVEDLWGLVDRQIAAIISRVPGYQPASAYGENLPELRALLAERRPRLILIHGRKSHMPPRAAFFYGFEYVLRQSFPLGRLESWELYERID